jgi:beta-lactamase regulating signal transducer with metallopeptidase domain
MLITWMAYATLLTATLCAGATAAERVVGLWRGARRFVWVVVVLASTFAPIVLATRRTSRHVISPVAAASLEAFPSRGAARLMSPISHAEAHDAGAAYAAARAIGIVDRYAGAAWTVASVILLMMFVVGVARLSYRRRRWDEAVLANTRVLVAPDVGPAVIGLVEPRIVIPRWSLSLDECARALMLNHEAEHIRAHDPLLLAVAAWSLILFPWNVALWMAVRRLRSAIEVDCDRRVLSGSPEPRAYGMLLIAVSARRRASLPFAAALVEGRSLLERRIRFLTAVPPRRRMLSASLPACLTVIATAAAAMAPRPQSLRAAVSAPAAAERSRERPSARPTTTPTAIAVDSGSRRSLGTEP